MSPTIPATPPSRGQIGLAILRIALGITFFLHGWQKLIDMGLPGVTSMFDAMHIPLHPIAAVYVTLLEFFGGIALTLGLASRIVACGFVIDMLGAIIFVHARHGYLAQGGAQLPTVLAAGSVAIALAGGGAWIVDRLLARTRQP